MRGKKLLIGESKMAESFLSGDWNWARRRKSYQDDIFRYIIYWSCWVGEALEKEDVEEPEDIASKYVIIYVDKIYMYTL